MIEKKGYMNTHESKSFQRIYKEFIDTILNKYCQPHLDVCSLGCYNDDLVGQISFKTLTLVDRQFGPCKCDYPQLKDVYFNVLDILDFIHETDETFDVVIMTTVVEHLYQHQRHEIFINLKKILKPGGVFILTYPNAFSVNRLLGTQLGFLPNPSFLTSRDIEVGHIQMYGIRDLEYFKNELEMNLIQQIGIMFKPLSHEQMSRYFNEDLDIFIEIGYDLGPNATSYIGGVFKNVL